VSVPLAILQDDRLTNADKRVWAIMRLDRKDKTISNVYSPTRLAERTHLHRGTIYHSLARLTAAGWYEVVQGKPNAIINRSMKLGRWVNMPAELLICEDIQSNEVVMYGLLKEKEIRRKLSGKLTYRHLSEIAQFCVKTIRKAVKALEKANWLNTQERKSQMAPIEFTLDSPSAKYCQEQIALTKMRLNRPSGHGESIALAMVMLAAKPTRCDAGVRSNTLPSPETGEMMEVDIMLPEHHLAIEYNGTQHYAPTPFASAEDIAKQKRRDAAKASLVKKNMDSKMLILQAADLCVATVVEKLKGLVPLRDLRLYQPLVDFLNYVGRCYQDKARRLQMQQV
jgi:hypothetical protein